MFALSLQRECQDFPTPVVNVSGFVVHVDFGQGARPRHHYIFKGKCRCKLGRHCPSVKLLQAHLETGGAQPVALPVNFWVFAPENCPQCGSPVVVDIALGSQKRGIGWRCIKAGKSHYWASFRFPGKAALHELQEEPCASRG